MEKTFKEIKEHLSREMLAIPKVGGLTMHFDSVCMQRDQHQRR
jgi:hypothetical protein